MRDAAHAVAHAAHLHDDVERCGDLRAHRLGRQVDAGHAGGGAALLYAARALENLKPANNDQKVGIDIVKKALSYPARQIAGALYVSCVGRGGAHFGAPSAELAIIRRALGDVPLVGFFAGGEIARRHLYGYTGVLTVFTRGA